MMGSRSIVPGVVACCVGMRLAAGAFGASPTAALDTRIELSASAAIDFHFYVRAMSQRPRDAWPPELAQAIEACLALQNRLGDGLMVWGPVEGSFYAVDTVTELNAALAGLAESSQRGSGGDDPLGAAARAYGLALRQAEDHFRNVVWPGHRQTILERTTELQNGLLAKQGECLDFMIRRLGIDDPETVVPVYLVAEAPFPGAFTHRRGGGLAVCFVRCSGEHHTGSLLSEQVLHEATHALDIASDGGSVFGELRERLGAAGVSRTDRLYRDVPHTVMFVQAGETIRRLVDPAHKHYGEVAGYYGKVPKATEAVYGPWVDYLDGKIDRAEAVDRIVRKATGGGDEPNE